MFHDGDLQSGISRAIQEQKLVACFVRQNDDSWSQIWEEDWLPSKQSEFGDKTVGEIIGEAAVLLRIDHGSQEANFLEAFCPISQVPTLAIVKNGQVVDKLEGGIELEEWTERLWKALGLKDEPTEPAPGDVLFSQDEAAPAPTEPTQTPPQATNAQTLLAERGQRLEAERIRREAHEKAERIARARAQREAAERAEPKIDKGKGRAVDPADPRQKARSDWLQQQAKRKQEAKQEKERIMARIEADKRDRRTRELARKEAASAMAGEPLPEDTAAGAAKNSKLPPSSGSCALQIRLFDGSSIKTRFAHNATLATAVRMWIKETSTAGGADIPYNFRLIQAPKPSRTIEVSEEEQTLADVGLMPTATLVLVPVSGYTEAYGGTPKGVFSGGIMGSALGLVSGAVGLVSSTIGYVAGYNTAVTPQGESGIYMGGTADEQEPSNVRGTQMAGADTGAAEHGVVRPRVKTLADQRIEASKKDETEFYNGNSLGTEPRKADDGDTGEGGK